MRRRLSLASLLAVLVIGEAPARAEPVEGSAPAESAVLLPGVDLNRIEEGWQLDAAIPMAELFLGERERDLGPEHPLLAETLLALGKLYRQKRDFERGERVLGRALALREHALGPDHVLVAEVVHALALLYRKAHAYERAEPLFLRARAILEKTLGPDDPRVAHVLDDLGVLYRRTCLYARAEPLFVEARRILLKGEGPTHLDVGTVDSHLGMLAWARGDLARGESLLQEALTIREKALGPDHPEVAAALKNLGILERDRGQYDLALRHFARARKILEGSLGPDHPEVARTLFALAQLYRKRDRGDLAEPLLERARKIAERALGPTHPDVAACLDELGVIASKRGEYARAEPLFARAIDIYRSSLGPEHPDLAQALNHLALMYLWKGEPTLAEPRLLRALAIQERALGEDHIGIASTLSALAGFYTLRGNIADAIEARLRGAVIRDRQAELVLATGSEEQKRAYMDTLRKDTDAILSLHLVSAPGDEAAARAALTAILRRKGRVLEAMTDSLLALRRHLTPEVGALLDRRSELVSALAALGSAAQDGITEAERLAHTRTISEERKRIDAELSERSAEFRAERRPVTLSQVAAALPEDGALLEITRYEPFYPTPGRTEGHRGAPRYAVYRLDRRGSVAAADLGEVSSIDALVAELRAVLANPTRDPRPLARALDDRVMRPARALLGEARALWVSPDGELNLVPFGALVDEEGRYLVSRFCFTYLTSGRDLIRLTDETPAREPPAVIANPDFGVPSREPSRESSREPSKLTSRGEDDGEVELCDVTFPQLPGTAAEAKALEQRLPAARVFTGARATERQLKALHGPQLVHIATHGFFLPQRARAAEVPGAPARGLVASANGDLGDARGGERGGAPLPSLEAALLRAGIALAGANEHRRGDDDGVLTALEAATLDLYGTKLIVLSACETGLGYVHAGDGVYGMRRALVIAGAETQVMSLWKVDDEATRSLMSAYYGELQRGVGRSSAMRDVQRIIRMQPGTAHPYYWAGFIVSGASSPMSLPREPEKPLEQVSPGARGHCACGVVGYEGRGQGGGGELTVLTLGSGLALSARGRRRRRRT